MTDKSGLLDDYMTEADVAAELRVAVRTVKRWRKSGDGPPFVTIGRRLYASRAAVKKWIEEGGAK